MPQLTEGEKWIRLLRGYAPVAENEGQQAEHVEKLAHDLGIPRISFEHPAKPLVLESFPISTGSFRNTVLTGTAGDGKTSLCFDLVSQLTGRSPQGKHGVETLTANTALGERTVTLIYDVTAWRKKRNGHLSDDDARLLTRMAESVYGDSREFFVLAVNDGQMHELFRFLSSDVPEVLKRLRDDVIRMHASGLMDDGERMRLINLSKIRSDQLMDLCLAAILDRPEWRCFEHEPQNPLFSDLSPVKQNYQALQRLQVRDRLVTLAKIADATGHHLPVRGILCLLANALLGHPRAKDRVLRPGAEAASIINGTTSHEAALHKNLFGENLSANSRNKREVFRFLSMLHVGEETTNELDELLIFGTRDQELRDDYAAFVAPDPFNQRSSLLSRRIDKYICGEINSKEETDTFLDELASERRRLFLGASDEEMQEFALWKTTVFHHAGDYLQHILKPLEEGRSVARVHARKLLSGLNRIWTGLLLTENPHEVYLTTGLDLTTSPVSDILLAQVDVDADPPGFELCKPVLGTIPEAVIRANGREFRFPMTLPRFEFLCRVADGAMPSSFSRECCADFTALKPRCLRDLGIRPNARTMHLIEVHGAGTINKQPILLSDQ